MSLLVGQAVTKAAETHPDITPQEIAVAFSLITGSIAMFIGLVRLGILVDFIPGKYIIIFPIPHVFYSIEKEFYSKGVTWSKID